MGEELGVPTPFNDFAFHAIKALEEKNSGLFS
jgi:2-dehydropantoate 2-reductase